MSGTKHLALAIHVMVLITATTGWSVSFLQSFQEDVVKKAKQKSNLFSKLKPLIRRRLNNEDDDYNKDDDAQDYDDYVDDGQLYYGKFAFDISKYSLKYARCQSINTWSDEMAKDEEANDVLAQKKFIVFRLCPYNYCSADLSYGCKGNYGEYIIELDDYMAIIKEEYTDKLDEFCDYCDGCYRRNLAADDDLYDDYKADNNADDTDDANDYVEEDNAQQNDCDQTCTTYSNVCTNRNTNDDDNKYEDVLQCTEFQNEDGLKRYIGPHCSSDGRSIVLGLFSDEDCTRVVGDTYDAASFSGLNLVYNTLAEYSPKQCLPCNAQSIPYLDYDNKNDNEIVDICTDLYYGSAKCNQNFKNKLNTYKSKNQAATEQLVCNFISNIITSQYDEYGNIYVSNRDYYDQNTYFKNEVVKDITTMQIIALVLSILLCIFLLMYACYLHRAIMRKAPWRPRRGGTEALAGQISRQNSGIIMGRSRSGSSSYRGQTGGALI